jgi:hypothetical protein
MQCVVSSSQTTDCLPPFAVLPPFVFTPTFGPGPKTGLTEVLVVRPVVARYATAILASDETSPSLHSVIHDIRCQPICRRS